jgi:plasmid replication initiation protein
MVAKMTGKVELEAETGGVVYQSNAMVNAFYHCSVAEKRLLNLGISKVDVDAADWSKLEVTVSVAEYMKMYSKSARLSNVKAEIVEAAEKLQRREIMFHEKGETVYQNILWQRRLNVEDGGYIKLSFTPNVACELTKLFNVGEYTAYTIEDTKELTSFAAFRLYEMAMQFIDPDTGKGEVYKIPVAKLRIILLGEGNEKYKTVASFNGAVVQRAAEQICEKTNMKITVNAVKNSNGVRRRGAAIQFFNIQAEVKNPAILIGRKSEEKPQEKPQEKPAPKPEINTHEPADYADYIDGEIVQPKPINQEETAMSRSEKNAAQVAARQAEIEARGGLKVPPKESNADFLGGIEKSLREAAALAVASGSVDDLERALKMLKALDQPVPESVHDESESDDDDLIDPAEYERIYNERKKEAEEKRQIAKKSIDRMRNSLKF